MPPEFVLESAAVYHETRKRGTSALEIALRRDKLIVAASLVGLCLLSWLFLIHLALQMETMEGVAARMMGMPAQDAVSVLLGTALSPGAAALADATVNFALVALMWAVMMVGMMLPSATPIILLFSALERKRAATGPTAGRTASFVTAYLAMWGSFSLAAAAAQTTLVQTGFMSWSLRRRRHESHLGGGLAGLVLVQKVLPGGIVLARLVGLVLLACGIALLAQPLL